MKRRTFIALGGAALVMPTLVEAGAPLRYSPGLVKKLLGQGKTVFVDFYTTWCITCRAQGRTIEALRQANPAYDKEMAFVQVDWDVYAGSAIAKAYKIPRRSTLLVLRGDKELGRIVAGTRKGDIRRLMNKGLTGV